MQVAPLFTYMVDKHILYLNKYKREFPAYYGNTKLDNKTRYNTLITLSGKLF